MIAPAPGPAALGCTRLQGYYIARPMTAEALTEWLVGQHLQQVDDLSGRRSQVRRLRA